MKKLLLVDDDDKLRAMLTLLIKRWDFEVTGACNGLDALEKTELADFDVIVCDMRMPRMNGYEFLTALKEREGSIPHFIILSGYHDFSEDELRAAGVAKVLQKPVGMDDLKEAIEGN